jgi:nicotinate-nucleotide--dimethylbenzimidazole phosphoribosyltransferase
LPAGPSAAGPVEAGRSTAAPIAVEPIAVEPIAVEPIAVEPKVAAGAPSGVTEPRSALRPDVASPSGSIKPPPAPELRANPPELPDLKPAAPVPTGTVIVDGGEGVGPDDDTAPIPVITPDMPKPVPAAAASADRIRAPFEPLERKPGSPVTPPPMPEPDPDPASPEDVKLDQIKDLYLTAEAIGEDALAMHFQQVSDRQRQLIKEYFDEVATRGPQGEAES